MSDEMDLSGSSNLEEIANPQSHRLWQEESDPTERMVEVQEQARDRAEDDENHRTADYDGSEETEDFAVSEALDRL